MAHLNMLKMIGLVVLLLIALTLPSVLPKADVVLVEPSLAPPIQQPTTL